MLRFNHYLTENALYLTEEIESNDAKGKLHELLTAYHLSHTDDSQKHLPERFAAETTNKKGKKVKKTPQETHDEIKNSISEEDYNEAHNRAKEAADSIREHLKKQHGIQDEHMKGVYWTSNKKDHKEFKEFVDKNNHNYQFILYDGRTQDRKERLKIIRGREYNNLKLKNIN